MSLTLWKEAVVERLRIGAPSESIPGFGADNVFYEGVPEEVQLNRLSNRQVTPYVAVWFGQRVGGTEGFRGVCGVKRNAHLMYMLVQVMASDGYTVNRAVDLVSDLLLGFRPAGHGELSEDSSATIRRPMDVSGVRSRYAVPVAYSGTVDT
jgi:hypothetical protein